ncbi:uncharacterized protein LOC113796959 [Dermatophagoides pteronyssinus]|uniref:uncharacterized protein LOC113796959 n=1 Tax=Dermatophagoides pteronyssinus TaxID=6956 RepID=UPI003F67C54A
MMKTLKTIDSQRFESIIKLSILFGVFFSLLLATVNGEQNDGQIKVEIFYETANHNVQRFMAQQFRPMIEYLNLKNIHLELYPYGQTKKQDDNTFECPYGEIQCLANKYQACIIEHDTNGTFVIKDNSTARFVSCFFKNRNSETDPAKLAEICIQNSKDDWMTIEQCVKTDNITELMAKRTEKANKYLENGLAIFINDVQNQEARKDLIKQICTLLPNDEMCKNPPTTTPVNVEIYYEAMNPTAYNFFHQQLYPYYHVLDDIIELKLIPFGNTIIIDQTNMITNSSSLTKRQDISNRFQALVVQKYINDGHNGDLISGTNHVLNFLQCLIDKKIGNEYDHLEECSNQKLNGEYIQFLEEIKFNGEKIKKIFKDFSAQTEKIKNNNGDLKIPSITVNNDKINDNAFNDLVQEICVNYNSTIKPKICTKVQMTIFYEPSHQPSRRYFLEHLKPIFINLYNLIDFNFNPAGRIEIKNDKITCPGGEIQCEMMKIHACVIDYYWNDGSNFTDHNRQHVFDFIWCTMKNVRSLDKPDDLGELCANKYLNGFEQWQTINLCAKSDDSIALLEDFKEVTHSSNLGDISKQNFPIVIFNQGTNNSQIVNDTEQVKQKICDHFDEYHQPDYCTKDESIPVDVDIYYDSNNEIAKHFFITQLNHSHVFIEEIANVHLHPIGNTEDLVNPTNGNCQNSNDLICLANAIHATVIDTYETPDQLDLIDERLRITNFINCFVTHPEWPNNVQLIGDECAKSQLKNGKLPSINGESLKKALEKTKELKNKLHKTEITIPWITLNDNVRNNHESIENLLQTVCNEYDGQKPDECTTATVDIYYSSYASNSRKFFIEELIPTFRNIRERIKLNLYPYGSVNENKTIEEECENDDERCEANKIHACVLKRYWNQEELIDNQTALWDSKNQTLLFINCFFKNIANGNSLIELMEQCENEFLPLAEQINNCVMNETESLDLLKKIRQRTLDVIGTIPDNIAVFINGEQMPLAESNLQTIVCSELLGEKPLACHRDKPTKVQVQFYYSALDPEVTNFIKINKFYDNYLHLEEIVDIQMIPYVKSYLDNDNQLNCPGEEQCHATRIHACVMDKFGNNGTHSAFDGQLQLIQFIDCYFSKLQNSDYSSIASGCVESVFKDAWAPIRNCAESNDSIDLLKQYEQKYVSKLLPKIDYVPWITIQDYHSYDAENHFIHAVCDSYDGLEKPNECHQKFNDQKPSLKIYYEPKNQRSRNIFITQFDRTRTKIDNFISKIQPIPIGQLNNNDNENPECLNDSDCIQTYQHSCIMEEYSNQTAKIIDFINCYFGQKFTEADSTQNCFNEIFDKNLWNKIEECVKENAKEILMKNLKNLENVYRPITSVPMIQINDVIIDDNQNLITHICSMYYSNDKPEQCRIEQKPIGFYYQTQDDNVKTFASKQLSFQSEYLDEFGGIEFFPYGKTKKTDSGYECPKGNGQCSENKFHACILDRYYNDRKTFDPWRIKTANFLVCSLDYSNNSNLESCFNQHFTGELLNDIYECSNGNMGKELYDDLANKTQQGNFNDQPLPWITLAEQYSEKATKNLFEMICYNYGLVKNRRCTTLSSIMAIDLRLYFSCDKSGREFVIENLKPFYSHLLMNTKQTKEETSLLDQAENQIKLQSLIKISMIPYGNTIYDKNNQTFTCPTKEECLANRYLACANYYHSSEYNGHLHLVEFTLCFFNNENYQNNITLAVEKCSEQIWFNVSNAKQLKICVENNEISDKILLEMKKQTESIESSLNQFPLITIGTKIENETNIMKIACELYTGIDYPNECKPYIENDDDNDNNNTESKSFPIWAIILIVIAVLVVIGLLFVCVRKNR